MLKKLNKYKRTISLTAIIAVSSFAFSSDSLIINKPVKKIAKVNKITIKPNIKYTLSDEVSLNSLFNSADKYTNNHIVNNIKTKEEELAKIKNKQYSPIQREEDNKSGLTNSQVHNVNTAIHFVTGESYKITENIKGYTDVISTNSNVGVSFGISFAF